MKTTTGAFQRVVKSGLQAAVGANNYQRREKKLLLMPKSGASVEKGGWLFLWR